MIFCVFFPAFYRVRESSFDGGGYGYEQPQPPAEREVLVSECKDLERQIKAVSPKCKWQEVKRGSHGCEGWVEAERVLG